MREGTRARGHTVYTGLGHRGTPVFTYSYITYVHSVERDRQRIEYIDIVEGVEFSLHECTYRGA